MAFVHVNCYNAITEECSFNAHFALNLPFTWTRNCVKESFSHENWEKASVVNTIIDEELNYWKIYGSGLYPSIVINNRTYRGQLDKLSVFNALCAGF